MNPAVMIRWTSQAACSWGQQLLGRYSRLLKAPGPAGVLTATGISALSFVSLVVRQRTAHYPFLPAELVSNWRYVALVTMSFMMMSMNLAALIGLPLLLTRLHDLAIAQVGFVLLPGATLTAVFGILSGRIGDKVGARIPVRV